METSFPGWPSFLVSLLSVCACGARTDLPVDDRLSLDRLPECQVEGAERPCESICGEGLETCFDGKWRYCSAEEPRPPTLDAVVRDFRSDHPDFERAEVGFETGIVADELGPDDKPVYVAQMPSISTTDASNFNRWYRDSPDSISIPIELELLPSPDDPDLFEYEGSNFFPIDGQGFGNEGRSHNYHFTLEVRTAFRYVGGESFTFTGDDDLWVFINRRLAIDLGGVHVSMTDTVRLDSLGSEFGLVRGEVYPLHLFFAERHTIASNFNISTTIAEFELCE